MKHNNKKIWFNIFRLGIQTASNGETHDYTAEELDQLVQNHHIDAPTPIVVGHPKTHSPAYGWVDQIRRKGEFLQAKASKVSEAFLEAVRDGAYRKISIAIKRDKNQNLHLLHVGFLGGAAPAVKGLGTVEWSEAGDDLVYESTLDFSCDEDEMPTTEDGSKEPAKSEFTEAYFTERAAELDAREQQLCEQQAKLSQAQAENQRDFSAAQQEQQKQIDALRERAAVAEFEAFEAGLVAKGITNPLGSDLTRRILSALSHGGAEFAESDDLAAQLKSKLNALPASISFSEQSADDQSNQSEFAEAHTISAAAREYQQNHPSTPWPDAVAAVQKKGN